MLPAQRPGELRGPIDAFFVSLADARQAAAVAIVLSGSGSDGALGAKAVSDAGGLTMAQDPATARADGMPGTPPPSGRPTAFCPPTRWPTNCWPTPGTSGPWPRPARADALHRQISDALAGICDVLLAATDHNFKHYKTSTLVRRSAGGCRSTPPRRPTSMSSG